MRKILLFLIMWILVSYQSISRPDNYKLFVTLENAPFDSLYLLEHSQDRYLFFPGEKTGKFVWTFTIPDSIIVNSTKMDLRLSKYDYIDKKLKSMRLIHEMNGKKNIVSNIGVEGRNNYIHAKYVGQSVWPEDYFLRKIGNKDSVILRELVNEDFKLILKNDSSDITVRAQSPFFSWFIDNGDEELSYDEYLKQYIELSQKYPDSRYLISSLSSSLSVYKSKEDVNSIYCNLSNKYKSTHWGEKIERYLSFSSSNYKFPNSSLPTSNSTVYENIVQDSCRYNLIIFTASWCYYCIKETPLLKQIYHDLNNSLNMTYICMDKEKTVDAFKKLIDKEKIPWRTLYAFKDLQYINDKYFVAGIPYCILVYPDQKKEIIEIRDNEQLEKLYSLCDNHR